MAMNPMAGMGRPPAIGGMPPSMGAAPMSQAPSPQMGGGVAPSTGNVMQITSTLRGMSDQQLQQYAAMHKSDPFVFPLAFQESQTRKQMRAGQAAQMAGQKLPPVVDQDLQQMTPTPLTGGAGQTITGGHGQAINVLPEEQGIGALNAPNLQRMADGGIAGYAGDDESLVHLSPFAMKQIMGDMATSGAGVNANADLGEAGRLSGGVNLNRMDKDRESRQMQALMANYMNNIGDVGINASVNRPLERGLPSDFYQTNLMGSVPVGEGRLTIGKHGTHAGGEHHTNAHSIGYNTPFEGGRLNANINKPVEGRPSFGVQYNRAFADGGIAGYADGGQQPGMFNYAQMAPAVDLHSDSGVTPRSMAGGGIARSNYFSAGISREKMLEIVRDTNAQLPKPIEEMSDAELNAFMGDNRPIPVAPKGRHKASDYDMDLSPAGNLGANLIYGIGKGAVGAGNLTQQMIANKTKELEGISAGQTRIGDYFTMPQSQYNTKYPVSTNLTNDTKKVASTETPIVENKEPPKVEDVLAEPTTAKTPYSPGIVSPQIATAGGIGGRAPTAEGAKQQANTFLNPETFKPDIENEITETGVGIAQQRALRDKMLAGRKTPYKDYEERLKAQEAKEPEEKEKLTGLSLLEAGLAVMGGDSPYAFQNLSRATAGVKTYSEGIKDLKKSKDLRDRAFADIEQARTAQANNDIDRSIEFEDRARGQMQEARRWSISGQQNLGLKNAEMASHNFDTANTNYFADRRANAELAGRTNEANARLGLEAIKMNMPPEAIRTAQYLGEGNVQTGYNMGVAKQHATELYTKWGQLAYPNGNMGLPNEAFLKMYPSATAYVKEGLEAAGFGKTDGGFDALPKGANVLQAPKK